jgi:hypothetical protein
MLAVGSHYYAIILLLPLGVGELVRWLIIRRVDWAVATAFTGAVVPLALFHTAIQSALTYSAYFWARPGWSQPLYFFPMVFGPALLPLLAALMISSMVLQLRFPQRGPGREQIPPLWHLHEISALGGFILLPFIGTLIAKFVTQAYTPRYVMSAFLGGVILILSGCYQAYGGRRSAGLMLCLLVLCSLPFIAFNEQSNIRTTIEDLQDTALFLESHSPEPWPIVVPEFTPFHRLSYYAPRKLARRLIYAADPEKSLKYLRHNTVDRGLLDLRPWFPERIEEYHSVLQSYPRFVCYGRLISRSWNWLTYALVDDHLDTKLIGRHNYRLLLAVTNTTGETGASGPASFRSDPTMETAFQRAEREWQDDALTACDHWTKDTNCRLLRLNESRELK